jgi:hypothetical protein
MQITIMKSKIHRVKVTQAELNYVGSITIDEDLMDAAGLLENEQVHIVNNNNGERFVTYVIKGERGFGHDMPQWRGRQKSTDRRYHHYHCVWQHDPGRSENLQANGRFSGSQQPPGCVI